MLINIAQITVTFIAALLITSLVEYWGHRLMHIFPKTCRFHIDHHLDGTGQGVIPEFRDYLLGGLPLIFLTFLALQLADANWYIKISWLIGCLGYTVFSAYAHQLQHDHPKLCIWLKMPVHHVHHKYNQWHHNFGMGVDIWDRVFKTYKPTDWQTEEELKTEQPGYLQIRWW